jgi:catalase-peroxidase
MLTTNKNQLTNDFFIHLLDMQTEWRPIDSNHTLFEGRDRLTNELKWTASRVDLIFGSHSELRAIAEVFASQDAQQKFILDFISAWTKVMELDRFDLR